MSECQSCSFQRIVTALAALSETFSRKQHRDGRDEITYLNCAQLAVRDATSPKVRKAAKDFETKFSAVFDYLEKELLPAAREVCLKCSHASDDDNLSRDGKSFASLDAMPKGVELASARNGSVGSWLNSNAQETAAGDNGVGSINLPSHIADTLRRVLMDFSGLDVFDQNFILHQMSGATMTDFASMKWVPHEFKKPQSKEFVGYRWRRLVTRFPLALALRDAKPLSVKSERSKRYSGPAVVQEEMCLTSFNF